MKKHISFLIMIITFAVCLTACYQHAQRVSLDSTPFYQKKLYYGDKLFGKIYMRNGDVYNVEALIIDPNGTGHWDKRFAIRNPLDKFCGLKDNSDFSISAKDIKMIEVLTPSKVIVTSINNRRVELVLHHGVRNYQRLIAKTYDFGDEETEIVVPLIDVKKMMLWSYSDTTTATDKEHPFIPM
jgi:hypothetical protein